MSFDEVITKVLSILNEFDNAFDVAIMVCLMLLNRNIKKSNGSSTSSDTVAVVPQEAAVVPKVIKATKKGFSEEFKTGLELYYSDKKEEEMTEEEKILFNRVRRYMEDE